MTSRQEPGGRPGGTRAGAAARLLEWYDARGRDLPFRRRPTPYRVWISEVMLQQTTVAAAVPYFTRFVARFPGVRALARAGEPEVLALWSGLGYYSRARNLLAAARKIVARHGGRIPRDLSALRALPGIGPYTAGAILSIGFNQKAAALDGNVLRVMARVGAVQGDPAGPAGRRAIEAAVVAMMPSDRPGDFNQALMDLGATVCLPRRPACRLCPLSGDCVASKHGLTGRIPARRRTASPHRVELVAAAIRRPGGVLLVARREGPLMRGMWEIPMAPGAGREPADRLARRFGARVTRKAGRVDHTITNHRLTVEVFEARLVKASGGGGAPDSGPGRGAGAQDRAIRMATLSDAPGSAATRWIDPSAPAGAAARLALTGTARKIARLLAAPAPEAGA